MDKTFTSVAKGFRKRTLVTAKLSAKLGVGVAKNLVKNKTQKKPVGALDLADNALNADLSIQENRDQLTNDAVDMALKLYEDMDQLKGLVMKFGQMASYMSTQLPPEAQRVIAKLQAEASALPFYEIKSLLVKELGHSLEDVFDEFGAEAIAAASIGQVHKAIYQGDAVAVKVQYPGVRDAIGDDLSLINRFMPMASMMSSMIGMSMDNKALFQEFHDRILEECDYQREAKNQQFARGCWSGNDNIVIPSVVENLCSDNVLVTEFMEGQGFYEFRDNASQENKNRAAETLLYMSFASIFKHGFFNGDPHPGNYLFREDGQVVFLDFGCVRYFESEFVDTWRGVVTSVLDQNFEKFKYYCEKFGFVGNAKKFNWDYHWELYNFLFEPMMGNGLFTYTKEYEARGNQILLYENKNRSAMDIPPALLLAMRLQWGVKTILVDLQATANFGEVFRKAVL